MATNNDFQGHALRAVPGDLHYDVNRSNSIAVKLPSRQRSRQHMMHRINKLGIQSDPLGKGLIKKDGKRYLLAEYAD